MGHPVSVKRNLKPISSISQQHRIASQVLRVARVVGVAHERPDAGPGRGHVAAAHLDVGRQVVLDLVQDELDVCLRRGGAVGGGAPEIGIGFLDFEMCQTIPHYVAFQFNLAKCSIATNTLNAGPHHLNSV